MVYKCCTCRWTTTTRGAHRPGPGQPLLLLLPLTHDPACPGTPPPGTSFTISSLFHIFSTQPTSQWPHNFHYSSSITSSRSISTSHYPWTKPNSFLASASYLQYELENLLPSSPGHPDVTRGVSVQVRQLQCLPVRPAQETPQHPSLPLQTDSWRRFDSFTGNTTE